MDLDEIDCKRHFYCIYFTLIYKFMEYSWIFIFLLTVSLKDDNDGANELQSLKSLVSNLRQLLDLHQKYSCRLSLSVFEKVCLLLEICSV